MARIRVSREVAASAEVVWGELQDIASHVTWMADAATITFTTPRRHGVGTAFDCKTVVGPLRLVDHMVCTRWSPGRSMGVDHVGLVRGSGTFTLEPLQGGRTRITWEESLRFPLVLGGPLGAAVGGRLVLRRIWRGNLRRLAERVEGPAR